MDNPSELFPARSPFDKRHLAVGDGHRLYLEQSGDPKGLPVVFLHGGPGAGCGSWQHRLFDPRRFRCILFDQRGCGLSTPRLGLEANTTRHLIADLETIRRSLDISRWLAVGGSWGALLAVAYAEAHPERVAGLALRGLLLGDAAEIQWAFVDGPKRFNPELWRELTALLPEAERDDPIAALGRRLSDPDPRVQVPAARAWLAYERNLSRIEGRAMALPDSLRGEPEPAPAPDLAKAPATPFLEWHYIRHGFFLRPGQLLAEAHRLAGIPGVIVQGRYDLLCPPKLPHALAARWPEGRLQIVEAGGHDLGDPGVGDAFMQAIETVAERAGQPA